MERRRVRTRIFALALALCFAGALLPAGALALDTPEERDLSQGPVTLDQPGTYRIYQSASGSTANTVTVENGADVTLILDHLSVETQGETPLSAAGGELRLLLRGENLLSAGNTGEGAVCGLKNSGGAEESSLLVEAEAGGSLKIHAQGTPGNNQPVCGIYCAGAFQNSAPLTVSAVGSETGVDWVLGIQCEVEDAREDGLRAFGNSGALTVTAENRSKSTLYDGARAVYLKGLERLENSGEMDLTATTSNADCVGLYTESKAFTLENQSGARLKALATAYGGNSEGFTGNRRKSEDCAGIFLSTRYGGTGPLRLVNRGAIDSTSRNHGTSASVERSSGVRMEGGTQGNTLTNYGTLTCDASASDSYGVTLTTIRGPATVDNYGRMELKTATVQTEYPDIGTAASATGVIVDLNEKVDEPALILRNGSYFHAQALPAAEGVDALQAVQVQMGLSSDPQYENPPQKIVVESGQRLLKGQGPTIADLTSLHEQIGLYVYINSFGTPGMDGTPDTEVEVGPAPVSIPWYTVKLETEGRGTLSASQRSAPQGTVVTLTPAPEEGTQLHSLAVVDSRGRELSIAQGEKGEWTFSMPAEDVTAKAVFTCTGGDLCPTAHFADLDRTAWYHLDVDYVYEAGLMEGTGESAFSPASPLTRAMLAAVLWRAAGSPEAQAPAPFEDVEEAAWYSAAVAWAAGENIAQGVGENRFAPEREVTREELAVFLHRFAQYLGADVSVGEDTNILSYADIGEASEYAIPALQWACGAGVLKGLPGERLAPKGPAARAEAAAMLHRFLAAA